ncbi:MAG: YfhO family protein, partial [Lachnospiraceae bacterium]|nr:YfhO family protein [Lachnospiraceae bacterium]
MEGPDIEKLSQELEDAILRMNEKSGNDLQDGLRSAKDRQARLQPAKDRQARLRSENHVQARLQSGAEEEAAGWINDRKQRRENSLIKPLDGVIASFLVPVLVMIIIFIQRGIFPFGEESFLRTDMYHQYAPFFSEFQYKLTHGGSLLYSWDVGMGVNFAALYAYYLASPFNWLLILCPKKLIIEFMTYMIVLKIGLSGLAMNGYLRKHYQTERFGTAFFGILYALSGYMAAYSWNIMWLDCIFLFPVIMLGLERLV